MKLATFRQGREARLGIVGDGKIIDFNAGLGRLLQKTNRCEKPFPTVDMKGFLALGGRSLQLARKDEIKDPHGLRLRLWVNGQLRQDSQSEEMIFKIPEIISRISSFVTLEPGDIIATGTPTGTSFSTQQYLKERDVVECEVEGIGRLKNPVKVEKPVYRSHFFTPPPPPSPLPHLRGEGKGEGA
ncbi:MAG: fumarylacetoacetate hydrolase family protein [Deltaproteobacteria bacterium]|nr:fumarylacetoacetate hydrolase family protein [Deltaproteobacteria bacterium]